MYVPDRENTTSLSEVGFLLDSANALLEDRRDLSGSSLGVGGVGSNGSVDGGGCGISSLAEKKHKLAEAPTEGQSSDREPKTAPKKLKKSKPRWLNHSIGR